MADQLTRKPEKRRNPWLPGIAGGAIGLLVAACVWFFFLRSDPPEPPPRSGAATTTSVPVGLSLTSVAAEGSQRVVQGSFTSPEVVTQLFVQIFEGLPDGTVGRQLGTAVAGTVPSDGGNLLQLVASGESTSFAATLGSYISGDTGDTPLPGGTLCYGATLNATDSEVATQICDPPPGG